MPRKPAIHLYAVSITAYASADIQARVSSGEDFITSPEQLTSELIYLGSSERQAAWALYAAHKAARKNPLAYLVTLGRDNDAIMRIDVEH